MDAFKKIGRSGDQEQADPDWERKRDVARGWLGVCRLAERERRIRAGEPLLRLVGDDSGRAA